MFAMNMYIHIIDLTVYYCIYVGIYIYIIIVTIVMFDVIDLLCRVDVGARMRPQYNSEPDAYLHARRSPNSFCMFFHWRGSSLDGLS